MAQCSSRAAALLALGALVGLATPLPLNFRPIVGVLSQPLTEAGHGGKYIAASYVKYLESAGARVVPVHYDAKAEDLRALLDSLSGVLFPGGNTALTVNETYYQTGKVIWDYALEHNANGDVFPLWGTCLGFEQLSMLAAHDVNVLGNVDAENISLSLEFLPAYRNSTLFANAPASVLETLSSGNATINMHEFAVYTDTFNGNKDLKDFFVPLSVNHDRGGVEFISTVESKKYPIFATQWHPEKLQFEWTPSEALDHSPAAIHAMQYMADTFVWFTRSSQHSFPTPQAEQDALIYNSADKLVYTGPQGSGFVQIYFWPSA